MGEMRAYLQWSPPSSCAVTGSGYVVAFAAVGTSARLLAVLAVHAFAALDAAVLARPARLAVALARVRVAGGVVDALAAVLALAPVPALGTS